MIKPDNSEVVLAKAFKIVEVVDYVPDSVVIKKIIKNTTGKISAVSLDAGEEMVEKTIAFETFVQIIEGNAEIVIDGIPNYLTTGQSIIIPAHTPGLFRANERFKMLSTILKSGYED